MSETFGLEIYASNKLAYAGRAQKLIIPAVDGEQGFLAHHANVVAAIIPGEMRFEDADGNEYVFAVSSGFVEMINNRAKLFCLSVESPDEIDIRRAQEAKERAEEQLRQKQSIQEYHMNQMALARAMTRLKVTHKQFVGRMGHVDSLIYLASPEVAAASAIAGYIANPEKVGDK